MVRERSEHFQFQCCECEYSRAPDAWQSASLESQLQGWWDGWVCWHISITAFGRRGRALNKSKIVLVNIMKNSGLVKICGETKKEWCTTQDTKLNEFHPHHSSLPFLTRDLWAPGTHMVYRHTWNKISPLKKKKDLCLLTVSMCFQVILYSNSLVLTGTSNAPA